MEEDVFENFDLLALTDKRGLEENEDELPDPISKKFKGGL